MTTPTAEPVDILLVDDRAENLLALEAILEPLGQRLSRARSGDEALRWLLRRDFAVILLDVQMPRLNGFETAKLIKARQHTRYVPIIFLTAISKEEEYVFEGYSVGAVDYMFKPLRPEILRSKVQVFIDLYVQQRQIAEQEQRLRDTDRQNLELRHMRELLDSQAQFREIVSSAMDAIIRFDASGTISLVNGAAERMFGTTAAHATGAPIEHFLIDNVGAATLDAICATADGQPGASVARRTPDRPLTGRRVDGESFPIEATVSCLDSPGGRTYTLIARDVSERVCQERATAEQARSLAASARELSALNETLNQRQRELERAMTARNRFYASMSHELRTPINAVLGYSTLLLEHIYGPLNDKQAEGIERTKRAARHLLELVNDVLDLSKIEAGKLDLRLQPVAFPDLIEDLFVTVGPLADDHGSTLSLDVRGEAPIKVVSDPRRLRQILLNLLSNAIKFGRGKPIEVNCSLTEAGGAAIEVVDHGEGISNEDQERIFHEFVQLGKTQLKDGTGLGLPISRRLAELLHGSLTVQSTVGEGSTFRLEVPSNVEPLPLQLNDENARPSLVDRGDAIIDDPPPPPRESYTRDRRSPERANEPREPDRRTVGEGARE